MGATWPYRPTFLRHLHNLAISGFYARELDADDYAFLERVKVRGIANGDVERGDVPLLNEMDFWRRPYSLEPGVELLVGVPRRRRASEEDLASRESRRAVWRARKRLREVQGAIVQAELERERREWVEAEARRKRRGMLSDIEWEAADPARQKPRHYAERVEDQERLAAARRQEEERRTQAYRDAERRKFLEEEAAREGLRRREEYDRKVRAAREKRQKEEFVAAEHVVGVGIVEMLNSEPGMSWSFGMMQQALRRNPCYAGDAWFADIVRGLVADKRILAGLSASGRPWFKSVQGL